MIDLILESSEQCEYYAALAQIMTLVEAQRYQPGELIICEK
jgi:hypothetical protein